MTYRFLLLGLLSVSAIAARSHADEGVAFDSIGSRTQRSFVAVSIGTPASLNLHVDAFTGEGWGLEFTGGYLPIEDGTYVGGVQAGVFWRMDQTRNTLLLFSLVMGYMEGRFYDTKDFDVWRYAAATLSVRWHRLFVQTGLSVGNGTFSTLQLMVQIGVAVWRQTSVSRPNSS